MNFFLRLLASTPGTPELHNIVLLVGTFGLIVFTVLRLPDFDPIRYAEGFGILLGSTGGAAMMVGAQRRIEGDKPTPNGQEETPCPSATSTPAPARKTVP